MEQFNYKNLQSILGEPIALVDNEKNSVEFKLSEVITGNGHDEEHEVFSAILTCADKPGLSQGTYLLCHQVFGEISLFVCPNSETEYEVIINQQTG